MDDQKKFENLLRAAKGGDEQAAAELFSKLAVRFTSLVAKELWKQQFLKNQVNVDKTSSDICRSAIDTIKRLCPITSPKWSLARATSVLHNVVDDFILNKLAELGKQGNSEAENLLFSRLRTKLIEQINKKRKKY